MDTTRRGFLATVGALAAGTTYAPTDALAASAPALTKLDGTTTTATVCQFCSVGCGLLVSAKDGTVVNIEGDPEHPINQGALCSKGTALIQSVNNPRRLDRVLYRAPHGDRWEAKSWDWAIDTIATRVKATRDTSFQQTAGGHTVNRTEAIAALGGSTLHNEECYAYTKLMRALGVVYQEHQARI